MDGERMKQGGMGGGAEELGWGMGSGNCRGWDGDWLTGRKRGRKHMEVWRHGREL